MNIFCCFKWDSKVFVESACMLRGDICWTNDRMPFSRAMFYSGGGIDSHVLYSQL